MDANQEYGRWMNRADAATRTELEALKGDVDEIRDRFGCALAFGTGGLRGVMGAGRNRMNRYVVAQATQGLANVVRSEGAEACRQGVVVAHDCRNHSREFAEVAASVLAASGVQVYLFDALRPTPELSFSIRHLNCRAGINITASHNPKEYNGYKVYWQDGAQIGPEKADQILAEIGKVDVFDGVKTTGLAEAEQNGTVKLIGREVDEAFLKAVLEQKPPVTAAEAAGLKIVYTPFYGTGAKLVPEALRRAGFSQIFPVQEQMEPNGDFPTVKSPNPEEKVGFKLALELAARKGADLVLGTDPDADRAGVMVSDGKGSYVSLTGNQVGVLLADYLIRVRRAAGTLPKNAAIVTTIVSTLMADPICKQNGIALYRTLTGFKYIGEKIHEFERDGSHTFLFGFEESYGYLTGTYARDKDAVVGSLLITSMAAHYKAKNIPLPDALEALYKRYGYYQERLISLKMEGFGAAERMQTTMRELRTNSPAEIGGARVTALRDYQAQTRKTAAGTAPLAGLPVSNVLYFELADGSAVIVRPSGTEPKVKMYLLVVGASDTDAAGKLDRYEQAMRGLLNRSTEA